MSGLFLTRLRYTYHCKNQYSIFGYYNYENFISAVLQTSSCSRRLIPVELASWYVTLEKTCSFTPKLVKPQS